MAGTYREFAPDGKPDWQLRGCYLLPAMPRLTMFGQVD